jgi:hypothetical protein
MKIISFYASCLVLIVALSPFVVSGKRGAFLPTLMISEKLTPWNLSRCSVGLE